MLKPLLQHMKLRLFLPIYAPEHHSSKHDRQAQKSRKHHHKWQADLTTQLEWLIPVIPDSDLQPFITDNPRHKFQGCQEKHCPDNLNPHRLRPVHYFALKTAECQCKSPKHKHGPMRKSTKPNLDQIIDAPPCCHQKHYLTYPLTHSFHHQKRPHYANLLHSVSVSFGFYHKSLDLFTKLSHIIEAFCLF